MENNFQKNGNFFSYIYDVASESINIFLKTDMPLYSANIAFFLIITIIPLLMLTFSLISLIPNVKIDEFIIYVDTLFPNLPYINDLIHYVINSAKSLSSSNIISTNILIALFAGSTTFYYFTLGIHRVHGINTKHNFLKLKALSILSMLFFFFSMLIMTIFFLLNSLIMQFVREYFPSAINIVTNVFDTKYVIGFLSLFTMLLSIYITSTDYKRKIRHNLPGAILSTILWLLVSNTFAFYFSIFPLNSSVYGSLSGVIVFLLWIYVCINIIFIGASINETLYPHSNLNY